MSETMLVLIWLAIAGLAFAAGLAGIAGTRRRLESGRQQDAVVGAGLSELKRVAVR